MSRAVFPALTSICVLLASTLAAAQSHVQQPMAPSLHQPVTLHETSPLVLVDVDVTDKHGIPIHGFTVNDFHVFEGGSEQQIGSFEEHRGVAASPAVITASLPPDTYTNQCLSSPGSPLFVILLDSLNTAMSDQALLTSNC